MTANFTGVMAGRTDRSRVDWKTLQWVIWRVGSADKPEYFAQMADLTFQWTTSHVACLKFSSQYDAGTFAREHAGDVKGSEPWAVVRHNWTQ